jgi:hypothetical protein
VYDNDVISWQHAANGAARSNLALVEQTKIACHMLND